jgi:DNA primase
MESQVAEVKNRIDIVGLVGGYVSLKKAGRNFKGLCPFHGEKTPSFMVSPERQIFKCFGCGEGGDVLAFYQKIEGIEFSEALKILASKAGVLIKEYKQSANETQKEIIARTNTKAAEFYHYLLTQHSSGKKALEYLTKRGLAVKTINDWQIGFAPDSWDTTYKYLLKKKFSPKEIFTSGLALPSTGRGAYDRFRSRIVFPIRNISGDVIGFSGRIFGDGEPKYLNSPDSVLFNKSQTLFGLDKAKTEIKKLGKAVLVEGNLDVISSHQIGVTNVICPLGTALTEKQVDLIRRFADSLIISFDQDASGQTAALRAVELAEKAGLTILLTDIEEKDPDELIRKKPNEWKKALEKAVPIYDFLMSSLVKRYSLETSGIKKITREILPYLAKIDNEITRSHYERLLAKKLGVSEISVREELAKQKVNNKEVPEIKESKVTGERLRLETYLLELILQGQVLPEDVKSNDLAVKQFQIIFEIIEKKAKSGRFSLKEIRVPQELEEFFDKLTLAEVGEEILTDQAKLAKEINTCGLRLKELNLRSELKKVSLSIKQAEVSQNKEQVESFAKKFQEFSTQLASVEKQKELI